MNNYQSLYNSLLSDFRGKDFLYTKKMLKHHHICKIFTSVFFLILISSLVPFFESYRFNIAIVGIIGILFFQNRVKNIKDFLINDKNSIVEKFKNNLNTLELRTYRENKFNQLQSNSINKRTYLSLVKEELQLIQFLIKSECESESNIDIITYKSDIEHIFKTLHLALDSNLINIEDFNYVKKIWVSDIQTLCNQYAKTVVEIDLKYLQCII